MSENPFGPILQTFDRISKCIQTKLSSLIPLQIQLNPTTTLIKPNSLVIPSKFPLWCPGVSAGFTLVHVLLIPLRSQFGLVNYLQHKGKGASDPPYPAIYESLGPCGTGDKTSQPVTKEALGSSTWTFLHTLAAQYPERPTRQQKKDVKELMLILSRMYPCKECADHFKEVLRANPVQAGSQAEFSQWMCHVHNVVNRSLDKPIFPCERVDARWGKLDCEQRMCDLQGASSFGDDLL